MRGRERLNSSQPPVPENMVEPASQMGQSEVGREEGRGWGVVVREGGSGSSVTSNTTLPCPDFMVSLFFRSYPACLRGPFPPSVNCGIAAISHATPCTSESAHVKTAYSPWSVSSHPST